MAFLILRNVNPPWMCPLVRVVHALLQVLKSVHHLPRSEQHTAAVAVATAETAFSKAQANAALEHEQITPRAVIFCEVHVEALEGLGVLHKRVWGLYWP